MNDKIYDVVIIGGGPGGYSAALYCARSGMSVLVLEKLSPGGQMATTGQVDNYPGFEDGIDGFELGEKMKKGADRFGAETAFDEVIRVDLKAEPKKITTTGGELLTKTVVIATGASVVISTGIRSFLSAASSDTSPGISSFIPIGTSPVCFSCEI